MDLSKLSDDQLLLASKIAAEATNQGIDPDFALAIGQIENRFRSKGVSSAGALGPMQLMPDRARLLGVNPNDEDENIKGGVTFLKQLLDQFEGDKTKAAIGYNAGPNHPYFKTGDISKLPSATLHYVNDLHSLLPSKPEAAPVDELPVEEKPEVAPEYGFQTSPAEALTAAGIGAGVGTGVGVGAGGMRFARGVAGVPAALQDLIAAQRGPAPKPSGVTSGEKWAQNWANQSRPGVGGVPEASAAYQRSKGQGKVTGEMSKRWGPTPPVAPGEMPTSLADRLIAKSAEAEQTAKAAQAAQPGALSKATGALGRVAGAVLGSSPVRGALAGAGGLETYNRYKAGDIPGAALSGLGTAASIVPTIPGAAVGALSAAGLTGLDFYRNQKAQMAKEPPPTPAELQQAQRPAFGIRPRGIPRADPTAKLMSELEQQLQMFSAAPG